MQEKTTMAISSYKRRFSSPLLWRLVFPPRHLSLVLHREVCLAWIRLLPTLCGLYTFWTIARGNVLVHRKSWRYTTNKKNESWCIPSRTRLPYFRFMSVSRVSTRDQLLASTKTFNNATNFPSFGISVIISTQKSLIAKFVSCRENLHIIIILY